MSAALDRLAGERPDVAVSLDVTRHPYSFLGDAAPGTSKGLRPGTWHESLLQYVGGDPAAREHIEAAMKGLAERAGTTLDYGVYTQWQPVESQRLLLWAARTGKQEDFMSALSRMHFTEKKSASERATLLLAAEEAGLDPAETAAFLDTDELEAEVWASYGATVRDHGIHSIPVFIFHQDGPALVTEGGPFRCPPVPAAATHNGSGSPEQFYAILKSMMEDELDAQDGE